MPEAIVSVTPELNSFVGSLSSFYMATVDPRARKQAVIPTQRFDD